MLNLCKLSDFGGVERCVVLFSVQLLFDGCFRVFTKQFVM